MTAYDCPTCGETHRGGCHAHKKEARGGGPCHYPAAGGTVCRYHGGNSPNARNATNRRTAEAEAAQALARLGQPRNVHPIEALLDLVHWTASEVDYWRAKVVDIAQTDEPSLTWGVTGETDKGSGEFPGTDTTSEAKPHIAYVMLERASDRLAHYSSLALKAGVDERRVQLAERQGRAIADAITQILDGLNLSDEQAALVPTLVPTVLRTLAGDQP